MIFIVLTAAVIGVLMYLSAGNSPSQTNRQHQHRQPPDEDEAFDETDPLFYQQLDDIDELF